MNSWSITICTSAPGGMRSVIEGYSRDGFLSRWNNIVLYSHENGGLFAKVSIFLRSFLIYVWYLVSRKIVLVHCHAAVNVSFWRKSLFARLAQLFGVPVLFHLHGGRLKVFYDSSSHFVKKIISSQLNSFDAIIVLSEYWGDFVKSIAEQANVYILPNYVKIPDLSLKKAHKEGFNIIFLGFISENKGIYDLLPAFQLVLSKLHFSHDVKLTVAGNGEVEAAKKVAIDLGIIDNVDFLGWVDSDSVQSLLSVADLFVLLSYHEGLPVALLEAMSWQLPVISTSVGAIPEILVDGENGFLISPGDIETLVDTILRLINDENLRIRVGSNARECIKNRFSAGVVLPKLNMIYESLGN